MHDLVAELGGYNAELEREENAGRSERADAVRGEIARVRKAIADLAEQYETEAEQQLETGLDVKAGQASVEARRLRKVLEEAGPHPAPLENTAESRPKETAKTAAKPAAGKPAGAKGGS